MARARRVTKTSASQLIELFQSGTVEGFEAFCTNCIKITGGDETRGTATVPFHWWPAQRALATSLCSELEVIVLKPRQMGASWLVLCFFLYRAMFWTGHEYRITSVGEDEASKALRRVKFMIEHLPEWCSPTLEISNTTTVKFAETQSWISALPATSNAGRGDTLNGLLSDEAAFQVYAKDIIKSARPALEKRHGSLIVLSTANGMGNHFQEEYVKAQTGQNGYKAHFFAWTADPSRTQKWYDKLLKKHGLEYMHENYPATAAEAFLASGRPYFFQERLNADIEKLDVAFHDGFLNGKEFMPMVGGSVRVWKEPDGKAKVMFVDVAEGLESGDWSNGYVVDVASRTEVCRIRGKMDVGELADISMQIGEWYAAQEESSRTPALLAIECNNHGIAVTKRCQEAGYGNLYFQRDLKTGEVLERVGWLTTETTRRLMLGKFQADYRLGLVRVVDRECLEEMAMFAHRGPRGKAQAPPGKFDDCVVSRAGAHFVATYEAPTFDVEKDDTPTSEIQYWLKKDQERMRTGTVQLNEGIQEMGG
jgi:hypothetical protein